MMDWEVKLVVTVRNRAIGTVSGASTVLHGDASTPVRATIEKALDDMVPIGADLRAVLARDADGREAETTSGVLHPAQRSGI